MDETGCIIHFEGKAGPLREITKETWSKIQERRDQWLSLGSPYGNFTVVANKSFEKIPKNVDSPPPQSGLCYHLSCYRAFTDKTKLERATQTLLNTTKKRKNENDDDEQGCYDEPCEPPPRRSTRLEMLPLIAAASCGNSSSPSLCSTSTVLPSFCLICKKAGPISVTEKVSLYAQFKILF